MKIIVLLSIGFTVFLYGNTIESMQTACHTGNSNSCFSLGLAYSDGDGVQQDYKSAIKYYIKACEMNHANGCFMAGVLYADGNGVDKNDIFAKNYYKKSCNLGNSIGCSAFNNL